MKKVKEIALEYSIFSSLVCFLNGHLNLHRCKKFNVKKGLNDVVKSRSDADERFGALVHSLPFPIAEDKPVYPFCTSKGNSVTH